MNPTPSNLAKLSPEQKRKMLKQLMQKKAKKPQFFPLSFAQQRLWFLDKLQPGSSVYNLPAALHLQGTLNIDALEKSINEIIKRHEILRTSFTEIQGEMVQSVYPVLNLNIPVIDFQELPQTQRDIEVRKQIQQEASQPFNLTQIPLLRAKLLKLSTDEYILLFTLHHIISDYWSMRVLIQELAAIYQSFYQGQNLPLPELNIQYVDYAVWQKKWLESEARSEQLNYWKKQLGNHPKILQLPTDYPRPAVQTFRGESQSFSLSSQLSESLKALARQEDVTLFMLLLAAFKTLLYRYTQQEDILVGSTVANRNRPEIENLIGLFVNNLVFRTNLSGNPSFRDFIKQVREVTLGAYAHQDLPFEYLVEELQPERNLSHNPLFQVMFILHNTPTKTVKLPNLTFNYINPENKTARFDLSLDMYEHPSGLTGVFEYNTDLFKAETISNIITHFQNLLEQIVTHSHQKISELSFLAETEKHQLLLEWNQTQTTFKKLACIHQLFETQAEQTPDVIAIVDSHQQLSYQQLNKTANQLAHHLQKQGVQPEQTIGICLERSCEMVIALLAVLKVGAAYIPLDPAYPQDRLSFIIDNAQISLIITQKSLNHLQLPCKNILNLDEDWSIIAQEKTDNFYHNVTLENLAYIIYTSGSTGQPKGVQISHHALTNFLFAINKNLDLTPSDVLLSVTSLSFDIAALELYLPLIVGARVVIASQKTTTDSQQLQHQINQLNITIMQATPATWQMLTLGGWTGKHNLKILSGGEALDPKLAQQLYQNSQQLFNVYGPTETTIWSSVYQVKKSEKLEKKSTVLIGRPLANTEFYILDKNLQPVPIGVAGELYIGGVGVARGYLNRADLTAERFLPNPFKNTSERLYKTGDLARYLNDGNVEYLGRLDSQVKLRGFRIELGEIEAILKQHPQVQQAVVLASLTTENQRLVAYLVPQSKSDIILSNIRQFLAEKLPGYMIPSAFMVLDAFPLTPNGKIDRRALPSVTEQVTNLSDTHETPRTPTEEILAGIWENILNLKQIGRKDNFFELGGHSLLATRVISQIRELFNIDLPLRRLFETPTIAGLAEAIFTAQKTHSKHTIKPLQPIVREGNLPLSFAQQRQWFLAQLEPDSPFYNIPGAVRIEGKLNIGILEQSINAVIHRHEVLRTSFLTVEGKPQIVISPSLEFNLPIIDISEVPNSQVYGYIKQLIQQESRHPFDLKTSPLLRVKILKIAETDHIILMTLHHIISDEQSVIILIREVAKLYETFSHGQPSPLAPLPIQYVDFAAWQRQYLEGELLENQLGYWRQQLKGIPTVLELPTDYIRPAVQSFRGATTTFKLSPEQSQAIKTLSQQFGCTLFMTLLGVFKTLLYRYTGSENIVIGSPIANRNSTETESLIGFFANTLALRTHLTEDLTFEQLLQQVREVALGAYAHQDLPFEQLVEALQPQRDLSYTPLFQVMFVWQNAAIQPIKLSGLNWHLVGSENNTAKFDLSLYMAETVEGLVGKFEYNTDLFKAETIQRLTEHFQTLLSGIITEPKEKLSNLPILPETQQQKLLHEWNQTDLEVKPVCLHQLFETQVEKTPHSTALIFENQRLTYQELNNRANQLAHYLQKLGVKPEVKVGICVNRSVEMVVAMLAILKAGGAYVPLDPTYPKERLAFMLEDAKIAVLIAQNTEVLDFSFSLKSIVNLDRDSEKIALENKKNPFNEVIPENLAYVIYTSGSTGQPKGVAIAHYSPVLLVEWAKTVFTKEKLSGVFASTSICFDLSVFELFLPLSVGGKIILGENALQLPSLPYSEEVTLINTVPSAATELLRINGIPHSVTTVNLAGEALSNTLVQQLYQQQIQQVFNLYGPSEDTTYSTFVLTQPGSNQIPSIGRPVANTEVYILDRSLQPVPVGVPGELYIGGSGLARGYLNRPELTAEKFIPNPFVEKNQANQNNRLYKTGDLVKYLPDGNIEYLGRLDNQVKIRGFRIELGEVEASLVEHSRVSQAVVSAWEDEAKNKRLIAYIIPKSKDEKLASELQNELRHFLKDRLPDYMIPSVFMVLETFPLTPNGKIDRKALPTPENQPIKQQLDYTQPQTEKEKQLAKIWSQILRIDQISINDNFFELGGDSILAIQVVAQANQAGLNITPKSIFQYQTLADLAAIAEERTAIKAEQGIITGSLPLTPIQHWFFEQNFIDAHHWNQSILLEVQSEISWNHLEIAFQTLLAHHDALRIYFEQTQLGWRQYNYDNNLDFQILKIDLSEQPTQQQKQAIFTTATQLQSSFNLSQPPLVKVAWFNLGRSQNSRLLIIIHHLIIDGISWRILLEDLQNLLQKNSQSQTFKLSAKTTSFKQWSESLKDYANSAELQTEFEYWQNISNSEIAKIPVDFPTGNNTMAEAKTVSVTLSSEETHAVIHQVPTVYQTQINDILLTALAQTFYQWTGQRQLLIELEGHGREELFNTVDLSRTVGWFTTLFPVLLNLGNSENPDDNIKSIKEQLRQIPNRGIGYGLLRYLSSYSHLIKNKNAEIRFNYLGQVDQIFPSNSLFYPASESTGIARSPRNHRNCLIEIDSIVSREKMRFNWTYSQAIHRSTTIENLAENFLNNLRQLIDNCLSSETGGYTPSDFPQMNFTQDELDDLLIDL
jgi:amino acid adenylation domain-containing protein/non-ribosomal peptide synthase protein (TIGR01720 family)